jgi:putative ABC transport system permease protein
MDALRHDVRQAVRALWRTPGFALAALLSLGLGIGANTAIYTVYRSALLKPLAVVKPEQLVRSSCWPPAR